MLEYKNNKPYIEGIAIEDIIKTHSTPFYIYSQKNITNKFMKLKNILQSEIFYSVKANSNQAIIKLMHNLGAGMDVVSIGELKRSLLAGVKPHKIIFEGVGKSSEDILFSIEKNIRLINIESFDELNQINSIANSINKKVDVGVRINPNIDSRTIEQISTGKKTDKFGIPIQELDIIISNIKEANNLNLIGISCHVGSQISNIDVFENIFKIMKKTAKKFLEAKIPIAHLDLGGGFAVKYNYKDPELNLKGLSNIITSNFKNVPYSLSFEPGRFLVAESGLLITRIVNTKKNGGINYIITDAGMNTLLRPSFYNTSHQIDVINKSSSEKIEYTIAGPICESSDILAKNITLPLQKRDDHLILKDVGAYGSVMASNYNSRDLPNEILVNNSSFSIIHKPLTIEEKITQDFIPSWLI